MKLNSKWIVAGLLGVFYCQAAFSATISYTYDDLHRLIKVDFGNGTVIEYTYDAAGNRISQTVPNRPPVFDPIGSKSASEGAALTFTVNGSDLDENPLTFSATNLPPGATFDSTSRIFSWTPGLTQAGVYSVTFTVSDGSFTASEVVQITVNEGLVVTSSSPNSVTYGITSSRSITILGSGFALGARITVGSLSGATVSGSTASATSPFVFTNSGQVKFYWSNTSLPPGTYDVQVTNPDGTSGTLPGGFRVDAPQPTITSVSQPSLTYDVSPSQSVTIFGTNFVLGATITVGSVSGTTVQGFNATAATPFVYVNSAQVKFYWNKTTLPPDSYAVQVTNPPAAGALSAALAGGFTVTSPQPTVTSLDINAVTYGITPSRPITIFGDNFVVGARITVGSISGETVAGTTASAATPFVFVNRSRVSFYWPNTALPPGPHDVQVTNTLVSGGLSATLADAFTVNSLQPAVTSLTPNRVTYGITPGMSVTVSGSNFIVGARITIGSISGDTVAGTVATATTRFVYSSAGTLRFYWPNTSLAPGVYAIQVTNPPSAGGLSTTLNAGFTVAAPQPTVTSVVPSPVTYGVTPSLSITISGSQFVLGAQITIGTLTGITVAGSVATSSTRFVWVSNSTLRFWWPNTALPPGAHDVTVTNPGVAGGLSGTLAGGFSVSAPQPTITSVSPTPVTFGSTSRAITIFGSNFVPGATITVGSLTGTTVAGSTATATVRFVYVNSGTLRFWWPSTALATDSYTVNVTNPTAAGSGMVSLVGGFVVQ